MNCLSYSYNLDGFTWDTNVGEIWRIVRDRLEEIDDMQHYDKSTGVGCDEFAEDDFLKLIQEG